MSRLLESAAFRLALGYGLLVIGTMAIISTALYFGTAVVIDRGIDAKLAKRFYRLDRSRSQPGYGLGLALVSAISHLHGVASPWMMRLLG